MTAYYNEFDPKAAAWLRELIAAGEIAPGIVDERSISDVTADDLSGFTQCHFFGGIGGWSLAMRLAGWPDDRPVWTGSCPCQPFSAAGKRGGTADERHLWPHWFYLISECQPPSVFGEQVASRDGLGWLDLVSADLEAAGYAIGTADLCAAGIGAPHIRQRLYFGAVRLADTISERGCGWQSGRQDAGNAGLTGQAGGMEHAARDGRCERRPEPSGWGASGRCGTGGVADSDGRKPGTGWQQRGGEHGQQSQDGGASWVADAASARPFSGALAGVCGGQAGAGPRNAELERFCGDGRPGSPHEFWRDADWLACRDGKWRPVEPGSFPLAHGVSGRVGLLRGYGNAIVPPLAAQFVQAFQEAVTEPARHPLADLPLWRAAE